MLQKRIACHNHVSIKIKGAYDKDENQLTLMKNVSYGRKHTKLFKKVFRHILVEYVLRTNFNSI